MYTHIMYKDGQMQSVYIYALCSVDRHYVYKYVYTVPCILTLCLQICIYQYVLCMLIYTLCMLYMQIHKMYKHCVYPFKKHQYHAGVPYPTSSAFIIVRSVTSRVLDLCQSQVSQLSEHFSSKLHCISCILNSQL